MDKNLLGKLHVPWYFYKDEYNEQSNLLLLPSK